MIAFQKILPPKHHSVYILLQCKSSAAILQYSKVCAVETKAQVAPKLRKSANTSIALTSNCNIYREAIKLPLNWVGQGAVVQSLCKPHGTVGLDLSQARAFMNVQDIYLAKNCRNSPEKP
jgi:hypothetical protein